ncbi:MAG: hypothetical protein UT43_C0018G0009 [Parcubacteria group bacterium GW2011_GWC1_39_29]|uniref:Uncharacterized protein n=1 Tax=Candidatus Yanofskybacteria bacterium GW2011_GWD1_39_16 TaxID=1619030 RepID=A0A837HSZ6_9BACT|nr:MAG: hypothetical protein UT35_C0013G0008 [Candidatus Yanofskybacteria bacterium GW2011_GWD1_39_16]KKR14711.1 MAG: hypothetical protein UT43_C0018G0009 [Parcubacteria group bacterium GW2011_GWC1_39_29]
MSILEEIRQQPKHIREIMFGFCVIATVSIIGLVWYRSLEKNLFVLLNPSDTTNQNQYAQTNSGLFGDIGSTFKDLGGTIFGFMGIDNEDRNPDIQNNQNPMVENEKGYLLPLSGQK